MVSNSNSLRTQKYALLYSAFCDKYLEQISMISVNKIFHEILPNILIFIGIPFLIIKSIFYVFTCGCSPRELHPHVKTKGRDLETLNSVYGPKWQVGLVNSVSDCRSRSLGFHSGSGLGFSYKNFIIAARSIEDSGFSRPCLREHGEPVDPGCHEYL